MKRIAIAMQIECDCGQLLSVEQPIEGQMQMVKEVKYKCRDCGTGYYVHIQEVKQPSCKGYKEIV